jgi:hypothetical protein
MRSPISIARGKYRAARYSAAVRRIPFRFTFAEWWCLWEQSGHWDERGKRRGQYQMARFADRGGYELGNVRIITVEANHREQQHVGHPWVPARSRHRRAQLSERNRRQWADPAFRARVVAILKQAAARRLAEAAV